LALFRLRFATPSYSDGRDEQKPGAPHTLTPQTSADLTTIET
jgi:hypothetical protein